MISVMKYKELALYIKIKYKSQRKKNGDAPGPPGDFVKSLVTERLFFFFSFFLKKISINCRFFTQKEYLPAPKKEKFCTKK